VGQEEATSLLISELIRADSRHSSRSTLRSAISETNHHFRANFHSRADYQISADIIATVYRVSCTRAPRCASAKVARCAYNLGSAEEEASASISRRRERSRGIAAPPLSIRGGDKDAAIRRGVKIPRGEIINPQRYSLGGSEGWKGMRGKGTRDPHT